MSSMSRTLSVRTSRWGSVREARCAGGGTAERDGRPACSWSQRSSRWPRARTTTTVRERPPPPPRRPPPAPARPPAASHPPRRRPAACRSGRRRPCRRCSTRPRCARRSTRSTTSSGASWTRPGCPASPSPSSTRTRSSSPRASACARWASPRRSMPTPCSRSRRCRSRSPRRSLPASSATSGELDGPGRPGTRTSSSRTRTSPSTPRCGPAVAPQRPAQRRRRPPRGPRLGSRRHPRQARPAAAGPLPGHLRLQQLRRHRGRRGRRRRRRLSWEDLADSVLFERSAWTARATATPTTRRRTTGPHPRAGGGERLQAVGGQVRPRRRRRGPGRRRQLVGERHGQVPAPAAGRRHLRGHRDRRRRGPPADPPPSPGLHPLPTNPAVRTGFYGLGWNVTYDDHGRVRLDHSGAFDLGTGTNVTLLPGEDLGIVTLTNGQPTGTRRRSTTPSSTSPRTARRPSTGSPSTRAPSRGSTRSRRQHAAVGHAAGGPGAGRGRQRLRRHLPELLLRPAHRHVQGRRPGDDDGSRGRRRRRSR